MRLFSLFIISLFVLSACSTGIDPYQYADRKAPQGTFTLCHSYGCTYRQAIALSSKESKAIAKIFRKKVKSAEQEREMIGRALAQMEKYMVQQSGLPIDEAEALSRPQDIGQMDCIDETVNIFQYLTYLEDQGYFKHHIVGKPIHRGYFIDGKWPHNTPTIVQQNPQQIFAVDSFYRASGQPPYFIEKDVWMRNWRPEAK